MKILANDGISDEGKKALENAGYTVITDKVAQEDLAKAVNEHHYEVVLVRSATTVRKEVIDACPGLKLIGRGGVGMDNIDVAYAREKGLTVINTPASSLQQVSAPISDTTPISLFQRRVASLPMVRNSSPIQLLMADGVKV